METPAASLIISVYSNTSALGAVLHSVYEQTFSNIEVIVSEDAQHDHMQRFIEEYPTPPNRKIVHMTQSDEGWRKNMALNRAIAAASTPYIIIIDGDCVLHPRFVEFHMRLAQRGYVVGGKRVKLNKKLTDFLLSNPNKIDKIPSMLRPYLFGFKNDKPAFLEEGFFLSPSRILGFIPHLRKMTQLKGCNLSFFRDDIIAINGFDEQYVSPAIGEDIDLTWRFLRNGCKLRSARNLAVQYHLYHKENWTQQQHNIEIMEHNRRADKYICDRGINQYK